MVISGGANIMESGVMENVPVNLLRVFTTVVAVTLLGFGIMVLSGCQKITVEYADVEPGVDNAPQYTVEFDPNRSPASKP